MRKGNTGLTLSFYATLAFLLALIGQTLLCGLVLGFVVVIERDEWLTKQVIQAFALTIGSSIVRNLLGGIGILSEIPILGTIFSGIFGLLSGIVSLLVFIFVIVGISKVIRGLDADIPIINTLSNWAFSGIKEIDEKKEV